MTINKKLLLIPTVAVASALALGSVAYACTAIKGQIRITQLNDRVLSPACETDPEPAPANCYVSVASGATDSRKVVAEVPDLSTHRTQPNHSFYMTFLNRPSDQDSMLSCMDGIFPSHAQLNMHNSATSTTASPVTSTSTGAINSVTRYIPADVHPNAGLLGSHHAAHNGTASICFMSQDGSSYVTKDATVTITGGTA